MSVAQMLLKWPWPVKRTSSHHWTSRAMQSLLCSRLSTLSQLHGESCLLILPRNHPRTSMHPSFILTLLSIWNLSKNNNY